MKTTPLRRDSCRLLLAFACAASLLATSGCQRGSRRAEYGYVAAVQVNLRDRVAPVFNKTGTVSNGERVEIVERSRNGRFVRVRSPRDEEGWMEQRYLTNQTIFETFQTMAAENAAWPAQARALTRTSLNMHAEPKRESPHLYQLKEGEKVELLKRAVAEKLPVKTTPIEEEAEEPPASILEDWWLVRNSAQHTGWVLGRMLDIEAPIEVAQYAEGQRIIGCFVVNQVEDNGKSIPQYVMLLSEPRDGEPADFNQVRVFTWNSKRDRYETAYRERKIAGMLPLQTGFQEFDKEGRLPVFTLLVKDSSGNTGPVTYKLNGVMVRKLPSPEEVAKVAAKAALAAKPRVPGSLPVRRE